MTSSKWTVIDEGFHYDSQVVDSIEKVCLCLESSNCHLLCARNVENLLHVRTTTCQLMFLFSIVGDSGEGLPPILHSVNSDVRWKTDGAPACCEVLVRRMTCRHKLTAATADVTLIFVT